MLVDRSYRPFTPMPSEHMTTIRALTHSGYFHPDEVTAYAILRQADNQVDGSFVRSRAPALIAQATIVFDVGGIYDPEKGRYDHHMPTDRAPKRHDGGLYSSAGLIWRDFGRDALKSMASNQSSDGLGADDIEANIEELWSRIDHAFIRQIDRIDTGEEKSAPMSYADLIDAFNPNWTEESSADVQFQAAADFAADTLRRVTKRELAHIRSRNFVLEAHAASADPRILELPRSMPWQGVVQSEGLPVAYAIYEKDGDWMIAAMPSSPGGHDQRVSLPREWAGLRDADIQAATGVADAIFVHAARFCGAARSKAGALELAIKALDHAQQPDGDPATG
jgi:uncharacterized UPF0160 family protein